MERSVRSRFLGSALALAGSLAIVVAMVSPATAQPDGHTPKGNAYGWEHNHDDGSTDATAPASGDPQAADTSANQDCGAYCPDGVGLPSGNGNGDGNATGKPCAGCVGNADDKNPPGQFKDGSDHNNGYECDGNNGIGKTNPAHSGCSPTTTVPHQGTTSTSVPGGGTTTTTVVSSTTTSSVPGATTTTAPGETTTTVATNVLGESFSRNAGTPATGGLAFTGGAFARLFWSGVALLLMGIVILGHRRIGARRGA